MATKTNSGGRLRPPQYRPAGAVHSRPEGVCGKWADQNGYHILRWYIDDAISGASAKGRVAFDQLITAAENGRDFEAILAMTSAAFHAGGPMKPAIISIGFSWRAWRPSSPPTASRRR